MSGWVLYIIGFIICYILCKIARQHDNEWRDVVITFFMSMFSWIGVGIFIFGVFIFMIKEYFENHPKPPKWL